MKINTVRTIAILAGILLLLFAILTVGNKFSLSNPGIRIDDSRAEIIKEMQELGNLETASYTIEKIIEAEQEGNFLQNILYGDRILLIAHGKVIAGVNLSNITEEDVTVDDDRITIDLPTPQIFNTFLDNEKTTVYDREMGLLSRGNQDLETQARQAAENSIRQAACEAGILDDAKANAQERVRQLFEFAGFEEVTVNVPDGDC